MGKWPASLFMRVSEGAAFRVWVTCAGLPSAVMLVQPRLLFPSWSCKLPCLLAHVGERPAGADLLTWSTIRSGPALATPIRLLPRATGLHPSYSSLPVQLRFTIRSTP